MELKPIGPNMTELRVGDADILFSYRTPVAARIGNRYYVTSKRYSVTTTRHIRKWLAGQEAEVVDQDFITRLVCPTGYDV